MHEDDRTAFLIDACLGDDALRTKVEALLAGASGSFLESPAIDLPGVAGPPPIGSRHGPYVILQRMGRAAWGRCNEGAMRRSDATSQSSC